MKIFIINNNLSIKSILYHTITILSVLLVSSVFSCIYINNKWCTTTDVECNTKNIPIDVDDDGLIEIKDATIDVDVDDDGLIEIKDATMLNNIRYSLDGTQYITYVKGTYIRSSYGCPSDKCKGYELSNNIDLSGMNWIPIGDISDPFRSIFNGNGYEIQNLTITSSDTSDIGLFGSTDNAIISNVGVVNININISGGAFFSKIGGLVGFYRDSLTHSCGSITNSYAKGNISVTSNFTSVGGLIGGTYRASCSIITNTNTISNNYAMVSVSVTSMSNGSEYSISVGGLVGSIDDIGITNSYATGNVSVTSSSATVKAGGLVGSSSTISNSYATGNISLTSSSSSTTFVGGLIAVSSVITNSIYNSSATFTRNGSTITPTQPTGVTPLTEANIKLGLGQVVDILGITHYKFVAGSLPKVYKQGSTTELVSGQ